MVSQAYQNSATSIIACNDKFENEYVIGRKDRGIQSISDLKGKRIGVARQTIAEFYLGRFLALNNIKLQDVTIVNVNPGQFVDSFAGGEVDAITVWQPYAQQILQKETGSVTSWRANSNQAAYSILIANNSWITEHPAEVREFLKSLKEAEDFVVQNPDKAKTAVKQALSYNDSYINQVWSEHDFSLSLDLSLVAAMNDEAHWMIANNLTSEKSVPDFAKYFYLDGLKAIKPAAVNISK